jgi:DNA modification methylase
VTVHELRAGRIHVGDWREADLRPGYSLAIVDGPYAMGMAAWDRMKLDDLADWYEPHLSRLTGLMAASASVYLWNTAAGWARLDPVMRAAGWELSTVIIWNKVGAHPARIGAAKAGKWPDVTEVCGFYRRGKPAHQNPPAADNVWSFDATNEMRNGERLLSSETVRRPGGGGRYYECAEALHPCQKPLTFAERMIRASSRPGDRILVPFGGTCREAVVCEWLARSEPEQVREYDVCELNQDGRDYIGPVLAQIRGQSVKAAPGQLGLFERAA